MRIDLEPRLAASAGHGLEHEIRVLKEGDVVGKRQISDESGRTRLERRSRTQ